MSEQVGALYAKLGLEMGGFNSGLRRAHGELEGTKSRTSSLTGTIGKLGAALGGIYAAQAVFHFGEDAIHEASLVQKSQELVRSEFGKSSGRIESFSTGTATSLGITKAAALNTAGSMGILFQNIGIGKPKAADMTVGMEKLAGSMAQIKGVSPEQSLKSLTLAMAGNTRGLKALGIVADSATIKQTALKLGLIKTDKDAITPGIKAQAIYAIATAHLGQRMAEAKKHAGDWSNVSLRLHAQLSNLKEEVGAALLPAVTFLGQQVLQLVPTLEHWKDVLVSGLGPIIKTISGFIREHAGTIKELAKDAILAGGAIGGMTLTIALLAGAFALLTSPITLMIALGAAAIYAYHHFKTFRDIVDAVVGFIKANWRPTFEIVKHTVQAAAAFVQQKWQQISSVIRAHAAQIRAVINALKTAVLGIFHATWPVVVAIVRANWEILKSVVRAGIQFVQDIVRLGMDILKGRWRDAWGDLKHLVSDALHNVGSIVRSILSGLVSVAFSLAEHIGEGIMNGIISGVESLAGSLADKVTSTVTGAVGGLGKKLGIGSPSKYTRDMIGKPIMQGIIVGVTGHARPLHQALTSSVMSGMPSMNGMTGGGYAMAGGGGVHVTIPVTIHTDRFGNAPQIVDQIARELAPRIKRYLQ